MALPGPTDNSSFITRTAETAQNFSLQCSVALPSELIRRICLEMLQKQKGDEADFRPPQCTSRYIGPTVLGIIWSLHLPTSSSPQFTWNAVSISSAKTLANNYSIRVSRVLNSLWQKTEKQRNFIVVDVWLQESEFQSIPISFHNVDASFGLGAQPKVSLSS